VAPTSLEELIQETASSPLAQPGLPLSSDDSGGDDLLFVDYRQDSPKYWHASLQAAMRSDSTHQVAGNLVAAMNRILKHAPTLIQTQPPRDHGRHLPDGTTPAYRYLEDLASV
jgi:hypothetical protein